MDNQECPGPFQASAPVVLASGSPRRKELMARLGLQFETAVCSFEELGPDSGLLPGDMVLHNARMKASEIAAGRQDSVVIGADTCVAVSHRIFGKPKDMEDAVSMLGELAGRWHRVLTGYSVLWHQTGRRVHRAVESRVYLSGFGMRVIRSYCATGESLDKAGAYAIQGIGSFMIREIEGSCTNVVGLPMAELVETLLEIGAIEPCVKDWKI